MPDGMALWEWAKTLRPTILTGKPHGDWAEPQKRRWCDHHLAPDVSVIVCLAKEKGRYATRGAVLVDDMLKNKDVWERAGGVFILHTSAANSIAQLTAMGYGRR